jgi:hypothetical protein
MQNARARSRFFLKLFTSSFFWTASWRDVGLTTVPDEVAHAGSDEDGAGDAMWKLKIVSI